MMHSHHTLHYAFFNAGEQQERESVDWVSESRETETETETSNAVFTLLALCVRQGACIRVYLFAYCLVWNVVCILLGSAARQGMCALLDYIHLIMYVCVCV